MTKGRLAVLLGALAAPLGAVGAPPLEEIVVWGETRETPPGPAVTLTPEDLAGAQLVTTEDLLKFEPGVAISRRFIGDANGTLGLRGANMFQTSRSMVFADGVPLHYFLQSRWDGAPRWSLIAASEIDFVELQYGPFSAEYGGNAMGGVVRLESRIPRQREFHADSSFFVQDFSAYGFDDSLYGRKHFLSWGDRFGDTSLYLSANRLENASQPQTFFPAAPATGDATPATGAVPSHNETGSPVLIAGDSGPIDSRSDNLKLKLGHDGEDWSVLLNLAHERRRADALSPASYLRDAAGGILWGGKAAQDGQTFTLPPSRLGISLAERESLSAGLRLHGRLGESVSLESNLSWFGILGDETRVSARHPQDPAYTSAGQVSDLGGSGWRTAEVKLRLLPAGWERLRIDFGLRHEDYDLAIRVHESNDYLAGARSRLRDASGGRTALDAAFAQLRWDLSPRWDLSLGGRLEHWRSGGGHFLGLDAEGIPALEAVPGRGEQRFSPKFSLGFAPDGNWTLRYSLARAYRFPIVEEQFSQYQAFNSVNSANPDLAPERGLHHNLSLRRLLPGGEITLNLFQDRVDEVIDAQAVTLPGGASLRTFLPVSAVRTRGAELAAGVEDLGLDGLNLRANLSYTDAEVVSNRLDPAIEGRRYPRVPAWRANLLLDYHLSDTLVLGGGLRYASKSFGRLDNSDGWYGVYGAQDDYLFVNLKADWRPRPGLRLGLGMENLFDRLAFVTHPWPGRTLFLDTSLDF